MGKKVLVISSSPRRGGNSDTLCNQFITGAQSTGNKIEKIVIRDKIASLNDYQSVNDILK